MLAYAPTAFWHQSILIHCLFLIRSVLEIFSWLIEVENVTKENRDNGKIKWSVNYVQDLTKSQQNYSSEVFSAAPEGNGRRQRVIARFQIMKDDIQSILPIAKVMSTLYHIPSTFQSIILTYYI